MEKYQLELTVVEHDGVKYVSVEDFAKLLKVFKIEDLSAILPDVPPPPPPPPAK